MSHMILHKEAVEAIGIVGVLVERVAEMADGPVLHVKKGIERLVSKDKNALLRVLPQVVLQPRQELGNDVSVSSFVALPIIVHVQDHEMNLVPVEGVHRLLTACRTFPCDVR